MKLRVTLVPLPVRGDDAVDVIIERLEGDHWFSEVSRDFWMTPETNRERAIEFVLEEVRRLLSEVRSTNA